MQRYGCLLVTYQELLLHVRSYCPRKDFLCPEVKNVSAVLHLLISPLKFERIRPAESLKVLCFLQLVLKVDIKTLNLLVNTCS